MLLDPRKHQYNMFILLMKGLRQQISDLLMIIKLV